MVRFFVFRALKARLKELFPNDLKLDYSFITFGINSIQGRGKHSSFEIGPCDLKFNAVALLGPTKIPMVVLRISKVSVVVERMKQKRPKHETNIQHWLFKRVIGSLLALFVSSLQVEVEDIEITYLERKLKLKGFEASGVKKSGQAEFSMGLKGMTLANRDTLAHIDNLKWTLRASSNAIGFLWGFGVVLGDLQMDIPMIRVFIDTNVIGVEQIVMTLTIDGTESKDIELVVSQFDVNLPVYNFNTTTCEFLICDIQYKNWMFSTGTVTSIRNNQKLVDIPSLTGESSVVRLTDIDLELSSMLLIDWGILKRVLGFTDTEPTRKRKSLRVSSPTATFTLAMSDQHKLLVTAKKASYCNRVVQAKRFVIDALFKDKKFRIMEGHRGQFCFRRGFLTMKCGRSDFVLSCQFAERSYIMELISLFSWMSKQMKGPPTGDVTKEPPTRRYMSFCSQAVRVSFEKLPIQDIVERGVEAKRLAMEALKLRQAKAIHILDVKNDGRFSSTQQEECFEQASKEMLFNLYRTILNSIPPESDSFLTINITDLDLILDGPAVPNRAEAVKIIEKIVPEVKDEQIGRIFGGQITMNAKCLEAVVPKTGRLFKIDDFGSIGYLFNAKKLGVRRSDFYHFEITCDDGQESFQIPCTSAKSVCFTDTHCKCSAMELCVSPVYSELRQDIKMGTQVFRGKKFKYRRLRMFDNFRMRWRAKLRFGCERLTVFIRDTISPFADVASGKITVSSLGVSFDGTEFVVMSDSMTARVLVDGEFKDIVSVPKALVNIRVVSFNPYNPEGLHPVFLPVDSRRMGELGYDPFEKYRTHTYRVHMSVSFADTSRILFLLDHLQFLVDRYGFQNENFSYFVKPCEFLLRPQPYPTFDGFELNVTLPNIAFWYQEPGIRGTTSGDPMRISFCSNSPMKFEMKCENLQLNVVKNEELLLDVGLRKWNLKQDNDVIVCDINAMDVETSSFLIANRHDFYLRLPIRRNPGEIPEFTDIESLTKHFDKMRMCLAVGKATVKAQLIHSRRATRLGFDGLRVQQMLNKDKLRMTIVKLTRCEFFSTENTPMVAFEDGDMRFVQVDTHHVQYIKAQLLELNFRPDDVDAFIPEMSKYKYSEHLPKRDTIAHATRRMIEFSNTRLRITNNDDMLLLSGQTKSLLIDTETRPDGSASLAIKLLSAKINDESSTGVFHEMLESCGSEKEPFLNVQVVRAATMMKCPVYKAITISLSNFIIRIHLKSMKTLIKLFPTAEDLQLLDLDAEENMDEEPVEIEDQKDDPETLMFCQEFVFKPFYAELSVKRKSRGVFKEFCGLPFKYKGITFCDLYGSKKRLTRFMKRHIKVTAIKAIPSMIVGSRKRLRSDL